MYKYFLGLKYLVARRVTLASVIVTTLGVMVMVIVLSIITGYIMKVEEVLRGDTADLVAERVDSGPIRNYAEVLKRISALEHVEAVAPAVERGVLVSYRGREYKWCLLKGILPEFEMKTGKFRDYIDKGLNLEREFAPGQGLPVLLGEAVLSMEGVQPGQTVDITAPGAPGGESLSTKRFRIIGFTHSGGYDIDSQECFVPLSAAQEMLGLKSDEITHVKVQVTDQRYLTEVKYAVAEILTGREMPRLGGEKDEERTVFGLYYVAPWHKKKENELIAAHNDLKILAFIVVFIIAGAGFVTLAILVMMVFEKRKDIGILKAVGCPWHGAVTLFLLMGLMIGLLGSALGLAAGKLATDNINEIADVVEKISGREVFPKDVYYFDRIPAHLDPYAALLTVAAAMGVSLAGSVAAAIRAALVDPVRALRYE